MTAWSWTASKETAAVLLAEGALTSASIARKLHIVESTLYRWQQAPEFKARVEENVAAFRTRMLEYGLARKENRIAALTDLFQRQQLILQERGLSQEMQSVAGGKSGLVCVTWKQLGQGEEAQLIPEYAVDAGFSREIRGTLDQVAVELGQRLQKHEVTGKDGKAIEVKHDIAPAVSEYLASLRAWRGAPDPKQGELVSG